MSFHLVCCCFHFLISLLPSLLVRGCNSCFLSALFTQSLRAERRAQPLRRNAPWGEKNSNPKSTSAINSSCWSSWQILTLHLGEMKRGPMKQTMEEEGAQCLLCLSNERSSWQLHMVLFKFSALLALQRFHLISGEPLQKEILLTICNVGRIRFPLPSHLWEERRRRYEHQGSVCQDLKTYLHAKAGLLLWTPATTALLHFGLFINRNQYKLPFKKANAYLLTHWVISFSRSIDAYKVCSKHGKTSEWQGYRR